MTLNYKTELLPKKDIDCDVTGTVCDTCYFHEDALIHWRTSADSPSRLSCRECHVYHDPMRYEGQFQAVFEPGVTSTSIATMTKIIAAFVEHGLWADELAQLATRHPQTELEGHGQDDSVRDAIRAWIKALPSASQEFVRTEIEAKFEKRIWRMSEVISAIMTDEYKVITAPLKEIVAARDMMSADQKRIFDWSLRYIPISFEPKRVRSWDDAKASFFKAIHHDIQIKPYGMRSTNIPLEDPLTISDSAMNAIIDMINAPKSAAAAQTTQQLEDEWSFFDAEEGFPDNTFDQDDTLKARIEAASNSRPNDGLIKKIIRVLFMEREAKR